MVSSIAYQALQDENERLQHSLENLQVDYNTLREEINYLQQNQETKWSSVYTYENYETQQKILILQDELIYLQIEMQNLQLQFQNLLNENINLQVELNVAQAQLAAQVPVSGVGVSGLDGVWVIDVTTATGFERYKETISFSGNTFTTTYYTGAFNWMGVTWVGVRGLWSGLWSHWCDYEIVFTNMTYNGYNIHLGRTTHTGTFSVTGDIIEFVLSCGRIETRNFSMTQNTLNFGGGRFLRR